MYQGTADAGDDTDDAYDADADYGDADVDDADDADYDDDDNVDDDDDDELNVFKIKSTPPPARPAAEVFLPRSGCSSPPPSRESWR